MIISLSANGVVTIGYRAFAVRPSVKASLIETSLVAG